MGPEKKFKTFEDLEVDQAAREFRTTIYQVSRRLPDFQKFELNPPNFMKPRPSDDDLESWPASLSFFRPLTILSV